MSCDCLSPLLNLASSAMSNLLGSPSESPSGQYTEEGKKRSVTPPPPYDANEKRVLPYGLWPSPITFESINGRPEDALPSVGSGFPEILCDETRGIVYIHAGHPTTGFNTILAYEIKTRTVTSLLDESFNVGTRVYEYGGGAMTLLPDGRILFSNRAQRDGVYILSPATKEHHLVTQTDNKRYADFHPHPSGKWVTAIEEDHLDGTAKPSEVIDSLVVIQIESGNVTTICQGADFYGHGRISPDGAKICWVQWNHPDMSWTGSELHVADFIVADDGSVSVTRDQKVAGEAGKTAVTQPRWMKNGDLLFGNDSSGWTHINRYSNGDTKRIVLKGLEEVDFMNVDFGIGNHTYFQLCDEQLVTCYWKNAKANMILVDLMTNTQTELDLPLTSINYCKRVSPTEFVVYGRGETTVAKSYLVDVTTSPSPMVKIQWVDDGKEPKFDTSWYAIDQHISFPRQVGQSLQVDSPIHAILKMPKNPNCTAPKGAKPPLIVYCHGGPTSMVPRGLALTEQFWTSRGYAMAHINYHGSSTYGRAYRSSLNSHYGILDSDDAASCAVYLAQQGLVDGTRCGIVGGSSGGYCVLQALTRFPNVWAGGVSMFGISKLKDLMNDTHKLESHYLDKLCFPEDSSPEEQDKIMEDRSPYNHATNIKAPLLLLQGMEDRVVPPSQAKDMAQIVKQNGGDVKLVLYEGEGHGFVHREHRQNASDEEEAWWRKTLIRLPEDFRKL